MKIKINVSKWLVKDVLILLSHGAKDNQLYQLDLNFVTRQAFLIGKKKGGDNEYERDTDETEIA